MASTDLSIGRNIHGFTVTEITELPELNSTLIQLKHDRTGARMIHLATADPNNLFAVGFATPPADSTGVAHILEHTALCGSKNYPVRDPFFSMIKRSLNTFMNAMTSSDWTLYPFASMNKKDFYNLMGIYLDAAFFPQIRERDFRQEGHRVEFAEAGNHDSPLEFKGVVYNEMKGAMADPSSLLGRRLGRALYPTTTYGQNSGGEPEAIPDLTWEQLKNFHDTYYHPSNAYFFTSGNMPLEEHLKVIEEQALSDFDYLEVNAAVPPEKRFEAPKEVEETYPVDPGEPTENKSMVQVAWLTCDIGDSFERLAMSLLSSLLLGNPAAPLYKALMDSKLGANLAPATGYHDDNRDTLLAAGLQGTDPGKAEKIEALVLDCLKETAEEGFAPEKIEAAIHQLEFAHREVVGDQYPYSLLLLMRLLGPWMHSGDPVTPLMLDSNLKKLREELAAGPFFENLIRRRILDNPHRVRLVLRPDETQKEREEKATAARLEDLKATLSTEEKKAIDEQARELKEAQEADEDLGCLPTLELSDIPAEEEKILSSKSEQEGVEVRWFDQPTNGIGYFAAALDAKDLPQELRPYVPLFCATLTQVGAAGLSYLEMAERKAAHTGGIRAHTSILESPERLDDVQAVVEIKGKALMRNQAKMFEILKDIFTSPDFTDLDRLHTVIGQAKTNMENSIPGSGHSYAARAAAGSLSAGGRLREEWSGLQQFALIKDVAALGASELGPVSEKLEKIGGILLDRSRMRCAFTAEAKHHGEVEEAMNEFFAALQAGEAPRPEAGIPFAPAPARSGRTTSVPVSYVARVFRTIPYTHPDSAALMVLAKLLRAGFLHREIREKGGAYGGMASFDPESGNFSMLSYRDPHLARTLSVYRQALDWASAGEFSDEEIKEALLGVFGDLDRPLSPGGKGSREFANLRQGLTAEMRRQLRSNLLSLDRQALVGAARRYLLEKWESSSVAVISGEEALKAANAELGEEVLEIEKI